MAATTNTTPTPIVAMHRQYEAAMLAQHNLDIAEMAVPEGEAHQSLADRYTTAAGTADAEADALRRAILYQVPHTATDAAILQHHIYISIDLFGREVPELEHAALVVAIETVMDFMASELRENTESVGREFHRGIERVEQRRRFRSGDVEA